MENWRVILIPILYIFHDFVYPSVCHLMCPHSWFYGQSRYDRVETSHSCSTHWSELCITLRSVLLNKPGMTFSSLSTLHYPSNKHLLSEQTTCIMCQLHLMHPVPVSLQGCESAKVLSLRIHIYKVSKHFLTWLERLIRINVSLKEDIRWSLNACKILRNSQSGAKTGFYCTNGTCNAKAIHGLHFEAIEF